MKDIEYYIKQNQILENRLLRHKKYIVVLADTIKRLREDKVNTKKESDEIIIRRLFGE